ncbi:MAG: PAS domain-containing protein [Clostridia bacterium]|nr:PAS domain-containing protein [Clostridia bacterium]
MGDLGFILIHVTVAFLAFILVYVAKIRNRKQIHTAFLFLIVTLCVWAAGTIGLEYGYRFFQHTSVVMVDIAYIGLILTPLAILYLGLVFAYTNIRLSWAALLLLVEPVTAIVLLFTNSSHHLFYREIVYETLTRSEALGAYFPVHTIYSYLCILVGMACLIYFSVKNSGFFSKQSIFILLGITVSFGFNAFVTFQIINVYFYTNLIAFFFTMLLFFLAIFRFNFLNIAPIALQRVVDHMSDAFVVLDDKNIMVDYNRTFVDFFGKLVPNLHRNDDCLVMFGSIPESNLDVAYLGEQIRAALETERTVTFEKNIVTPVFNRHFTIEITPISNQHRILGTLILLKDITDQKKSLEALQAHQQILLEQERLASLGQLIGGIAHNLKTPIMSLSGGLEALSDLVDEYHDAIGDVQVTTQDHREISTDMRSWIEKMRPYCSHMSDVISAVKGQAVQFTADTGYFTVDDLLRRVEILMQHELKNHLCTLNIHSRVDNHTEIAGELQNLVQVFDNLIMNAMQAYGRDNGVIDIEIDRADRSLMFQVKDYANGIPKPVADRLFREMVTTKGKDGTGLGLYMSHSMIRGAFGGNLTFTTEEGVGTTFWIQIPTAEADALEREAAAGRTAAAAAASEGPDEPGESEEPGEPEKSEDSEDTDDTSADPATV